MMINVISCFYVPTYLICVVWFVRVVVNVMFMKCVVSTWHICSRRYVAAR